jgi:hypothetical protein
VAQEKYCVLNRYVDKVHWAARENGQPIVVMVERASTLPL